jgi:hypothetical protein
MLQRARKPEMATGWAIRAFKLFKYEQNQIDKRTAI